MFVCVEVINVINEGVVYISEQYKEVGIGVLVDSKVNVDSVKEVNERFIELMSG